MARFRIPVDSDDYSDHDKIVTASHKIDPAQKFNEKLVSY